MAIPSHRIHTIHSAFGPTFGPVSAAQASSFAHLPNISVCSSRSSGRDFSIISTSSAPVQSPLGSGSRISAHHYPVSTRRAPPPPPSRTLRTAIVTDDPFADGPIEIVSPPPPRSLHSAPTPLISSRTRISPQAAPSISDDVPSAVIVPSSSSSVTSVSLPPGIEPDPADSGYRFVRGRLVASVLLNRNYGRPLGRRLGSYGEGRTYVKSGLSRVVQVET